MDANPESKSRSRRSGRPLHRRRFSPDQKRAIVEQSMKPGMSVSRAARDQDLNTNQVFKWRRLHERGLLGQGRKTVAMLPVRIEERAPVAAGIMIQPPIAEVRHLRAVKTGSIEIELPGGRVMVRGAVDRAVLRVVIKLLSR